MHKGAAAHEISVRLDGCLVAVTKLEAAIRNVLTTNSRATARVQDLEKAKSRAEQKAREGFVSKTDEAKGLERLFGTFTYERDLNRSIARATGTNPDVLKAYAEVRVTASELKSALTSAIDVVDHSVAELQATLEVAGNLDHHSVRALKDAYAYALSSARDLRNAHATIVAVENDSGVVKGSANRELGLDRLYNLARSLASAQLHGSQVLETIRSDVVRLDRRPFDKTDESDDDTQVRLAARVERIVRAVLGWARDPDTDDVSIEVFLTAKDTRNRKYVIALTVRTCTDGLVKAARRRHPKFWRCFCAALPAGFLVALPSLVSDVLSVGFAMPDCLIGAGGISLVLAISILAFQNAYREWHR